MTQANHLRTIRLRLKLSLNYTAGHLGISRNSLRKYEFFPLYRIPAHILSGLSKIYQISPAKLLNSPSDYSFIGPSIFTKVLNEPAKTDSCTWLNSYLHYQIRYTPEEVAQLYQALDQRGQNLVSRLIQLESKYSDPISATYHKEN